MRWRHRCDFLTRLLLNALVMAVFMVHELGPTDTPFVRMYHLEGGTGAQAGKQELSAMLCADDSGFRVEIEGITLPRPNARRVRDCKTGLRRPFVSPDASASGSWVFSRGVAFGFVAVVFSFFYIFFTSAKGERLLRSVCRRFFSWLRLRHFVFFFRCTKIL